MILLSHRKLYNHQSEIHVWDFVSVKENAYICTYGYEHTYSQRHKSTSSQ